MILTLGLKILGKHISFNCRLLLYSKYGEGDSQLLLIIMLTKRIKKEPIDYQVIFLEGYCFLAKI